MANSTSDVFSIFLHLIWGREVVVCCSPEESATKQLCLLSSAFGSAACSAVLAWFLTSALVLFHRFPSAPFGINLDTDEDHSHNIYKRFHIKCWMQKSLQVRHCWDPFAAGFLFCVQPHLGEKGPKGEAIVRQFPSYILQSELSFLDNLVYKRF